MIDTLARHRSLAHPCSLSGILASLIRLYCDGRSSLFVLQMGLRYRYLHAAVANLSVELLLASDQLAVLAGELVYDLLV